MDLFTYLGAKNGKFTLPHKSDLFAYLLGKNSKLPVQTASGTTLEITAKKTNLLELTLDKMCSQDGTPTPDYPIEVNVAEGYRNLFDGEIELGSINPRDGTNTGSTSRTRSKNFIEVEPNTTYTFKRNVGENRWIIGYTENKIGITDGNYSGYASALFMSQDMLAFTFTTTSTTKYIKWYDTNSTDLNEEVMLNEGTEALPYVPYGTNYINLNITDGVNSINKQIPLNDNFIGGIGDYKDVLTIDETGSISLVKNIGKVVLDGSESWTFGSSSVIKFRLLISNAINFIDDQDNAPLVFTNRYQPFAWNSVSSYTNGVTANTGQLKYLCFKNVDITTLEAWQTDLATNNIIVYYILETPTTTPLGSIDISLFKGTNIITNSDNCNMTIKYY